MPSPYSVVLGDRFDDLHPRLRAYFGEIPEGQVGHGVGTFQVVGTPRRWLWPVLWVLGRQGVVFPGWRHDVPFTVTNSPHRDARGTPVVAATRVFHFAEGDRRMRDAITAHDSVLVDHLGFRRRYLARFDCAVADGALRLTSTRLLVRVGRWRLRIPRAIAPVVRLSERVDAEGLQRVALTLDAPLLGRLYEYSGSFVYEIRRGKAQE